ncbi:MAG: OmpA family protein [Campylobacterota bacterium]|nr:OmpA family protein [Campylobacterota bacterium]
MLSASKSLPFELTYPTVTKTQKLKQERYGKLQFYFKGEGYRSAYGHIWKQKFNYPKFENGTHKKVVRDFFIQSLTIKPSEINADNYGHFTKDDKEYWLKLNTYATSYNYELLEVADFPKMVSFDNNISYKLDKQLMRKYGKVEIPKNIAIAHVKDYAIERYSYKRYNEHTFYYNKKAHIHKGKFWKLDFRNSGTDKNSHRYAIAHDYKAKILELDATILKDEDNNILFRLEHNNAINYIYLSVYNKTFSLTIIEEEAFKQSLILTPDAIKAELDKTGKITLDGIFFDFNKATLKPESKKAILSAVALMQRYGDLVLLVHGHTDNKGSDTYNHKLSKERAASVRKAIITEGIESSRLQSQGYGEEKPIASNETEEGRAQNRRVELHKVSGGDKKSIITIDFIKPLEHSVIASKYEYDNQELSTHKTKPYSKKKELVNHKGHLKTINYEILKEGKIDRSISRKEIIKNYENILELYNANILGIYGNDLHFKIKDRGDDVSVYGRIDAYDGKYSINFLIEHK